MPAIQVQSSYPADRVIRKVEHNRTDNKMTARNAVVVLIVIIGLGKVVGLTKSGNTPGVGSIDGTFDKSGRVSISN